MSRQQEQQRIDEDKRHNRVAEGLDQERNAVDAARMSISAGELDIKHDALDIEHMNAVSKRIDALKSGGTKFDKQIVAAMDEKGFKTESDAVKYLTKLEEAGKMINNNYGKFANGVFFFDASEFKDIASRVAQSLAEQSLASNPNISAADAANNAISTMGAMFETGALIPDEVVKQAYESQSPTIAKETLTKYLTQTYGFSDSQAESLLQKWVTSGTLDSMEQRSKNVR